MTDGSSLQPETSTSDTTMNRPSADAALETASEQTGDYRDDLQSRRWDAAPLKNPEAQKTDPRIAVAGIVILSAITLVVLVLGYGSGFWG